MKGKNNSNIYIADRNPISSSTRNQISKQSDKYINFLQNEE